MNRSQIQSANALAKVLEDVARDVRRGGPLFIAFTVISRNTVEADKPMVMVCKMGNGASPERVAAAFAELAHDAVASGSLVPD